MGFIEMLRFQFSRLKNFIFHPPVENSGPDSFPAYSRKMEDNINLWYSMFINEPPWAVGRVKTIGIPAAICREIANPTFLEFQENITGSERADFLADSFWAAKEKFKSNLETALALGGIAFKPYPYNRKLLVDASGPASFSPTKFDEAGVCIGGAFKSRPARAGRDWYVKIEYHELDGTTYTIKNKAYLSNQDGTVGTPVSLGVVKEWDGLQPEVTISPVDGPLFAYFKPPIANNIDTQSDAGVSIYSGAAVDLIKQADEQWEALSWEYYSGRRKVHMDGTVATAKQFDKDLFEIGPFSSTGDFYNVYSPEFRDEPLYRGFQSILKQIEFQCGLAYGTISDPQTVDKTATEVRNSKKRMYETVDAIQKSLEHTFDRLLYAMNVYASLYGLAPEGDYEASYEWGDSILNDEETRRIENQDMRADVSANLIRPELYIMKKYKVTEEEAISMMPKLEDMVDEEQKEVE